MSLQRSLDFSCALTLLGARVQAYLDALPTNWHSVRPLSVFRSVDIRQNIRN